MRRLRSLDFGAHRCLVAKVAAAADPCKNLHVITLNIGSMAKHLGQLVELLLTHCPHILLLQEAKTTDHELRAWRHRLRDLGYCIYIDRDHDLACIWRRGLNIARIRPPDALSTYRLNYYALQLKDTRILLRNVHYPSNKDSDRRALEETLNECDQATFFVDVGDFNSTPKARLNSVVLMPSVATYRLNPLSDVFSTTIDGARVSAALFRGARVIGLAPLVGVQHRPVSLHLEMVPITSQCFRWNCSRPVPGYDLWDPAAVDVFRGLISSDLNEAWRLWHSLAGGAPAPSRISPHGPWTAGWAVGADSAELAVLWRRCRQALAMGTSWGDDRAEALLSQISGLIDRNTAARREVWRADMQDRAHAAKWVKNRTTADCDIQHTMDWVASDEGSVDASLSAIKCSAEEVQEATSIELAGRWNAGIYRYDRKQSGVQLSRLATLTTIFVATAAEPPPLVMPPLPGYMMSADYFGVIPFDDALISPWVPGHILRYAPTGSTSLDGWDGAALKYLDETSKAMLCLLLDECNKGRFPEFFEQARSVGIPKNDGTTDRRPLTIMSAIYRCWARRIARHIAIWMDRFMPPEVYGARPNKSAADAAWDLALDVDLHRVDKTELIVATLDQKQCFDRLSIEQLIALARCIGMPSACCHALLLYKRIERHLFIDGQPTGHVIFGNHIRGVPQGCPIAVNFCNLTSWAWQLSIRRLGLPVKCGSFLDDRLLRSSVGAQPLADAIKATKAIDDCFGAELNTKKSRWGGTTAPRSTQIALLGDIPNVKVLLYLGVDIVLRGGAKRAIRIRMGTRVADLRRRCTVIRCLPPAQRGILVSDAIQGLWLDGGTAISTSTLRQTLSTTAAALRGTDAPRYKRRARLAEHLLGPGVHRTLGSAASIYRGCLQLTRLLAKGLTSAGTIEKLWRARPSCAGPLYALQNALAALRITWSAPLTLTAGDLTFGLDTSDEHYIEPLEIGEFARPAAPRQKFASALRRFLRDAVARCLALDRPRDYSTLERGIHDDDGFRHLMYSVMHRQSGPALLSAGQWTKVHLHIAKLEDDDLCVRCGDAPEFLQHRLWDCKCNAPYRAKLNAAVSRARDFPSSLPLSIARTGIAPKGWSLLSLPEYAALLDYLWCVSADATIALARNHRDLQPALPFAYDAVQAMRSIKIPFLVSSAPMPLPRRLRDPKTHLSGSILPPADFSGFAIYVDGSYTCNEDGSSIAGWGCYVVGPVGPPTSLCGPITIRGPHAPDQFIYKLSNNVAEVVAIWHAVQFISRLPAPCTCAIIFDSMYAAYTVRQSWRAKSNLALVRHVGSWVSRAAALVDLQWFWVRGHSRVAGNEAADKLAKRGSKGETLG